VTHDLNSARGELVNLSSEDRMSVEIAVLNALGLIPAVIENEIVAGIEDGVALFRDHTEVASIGISVHDSGFVAAETGFGGISYGPQSFALYVDPSSHTKGHSN
jgi:hypothetical protein